MRGVMQSKTLTPREIMEELASLTDGEAIFYPNYEDALVGICQQFGRPPVALYDYDKCLKILQREGATYEEAVEWFEYNTLGNWVGDYTPAFVVFG